MTVSYRGFSITVGLLATDWYGYSAGTPVFDTIGPDGARIGIFMGLSVVKTVIDNKIKYAEVSRR